MLKKYFPKYSSAVSPLLFSNVLFNLLRVRLQCTGKKCSEYVMCFLILPKGIPLDLVTSLKSPHIYLVSSCRKPNFSKFYSALTEFEPVWTQMRSHSWLIKYLPQTFFSFPSSQIHLFLLHNPVQLSSCSVVSDSATPWTAACQEPCPTPTPRVYSNSCPLSWWCHPVISSSVVPFSSHLQSFLASRSFPVSQFFASGGSFTLQHQSFQWIFRTDFL